MCHGCLIEKVPPDNIKEGISFAKEGIGVCEQESNKGNCPEGEKKKRGKNTPSQEGEGLYPALQSTSTCQVHRETTIVATGRNSLRQGQRPASRSEHGREERGNKVAANYHRNKEGATNQEGAGERGEDTTIIKIKCGRTKQMPPMEESTL